MLDTWWDTIWHLDSKILRHGNIYVPGHSGVLFNERADKLAGEAEPFSELIQTPADVIAELEVRVQEEENLVQGETFSVQRLTENGWTEPHGTRSSLEC